jgi:hypothetical protein
MLKKRLEHFKQLKMQRDVFAGEENNIAIFMYLFLLPDGKIYDGF